MECGLSYVRLIFNSRALNSSVSVQETSCKTSSDYISSFLEVKSSVSLLSLLLSSLSSTWVNFMVKTVE